MQPTFSPRLAPYFAVRDARGLVDFLERALGGTLTFEEVEPEGRLVHAEVRVADSIVMLAELPAGGKPLPSRLHLYVDDADRSYERAIGSGATSLRSPANAPDRTRRGGVVDPWGNEWWFSHRLKAPQE